MQKSDSCFDALWEKCREAYPLAVIRDESFSRWRFFTHPFQEYEVYVYRAFFGKEVKAYAVVVIEEEKASLIDLFSAAVGKWSLGFLCTAGC